MREQDRPRSSHPALFPLKMWSMSRQCPKKKLRMTQDYTMLRVLASPLLAFVESPRLTLDVDHLRCREGVATCRRFSLLMVPIE